MDTSRIAARLEAIFTAQRSTAGEAVRLNEPEVFDLLQDLGLATAPYAFCPAGSGAEEKRDWAGRAHGLVAGSGKLLLKVVGREILHKTEAGGVMILSGEECASPAAILENVDRMQAEILSRVDEGQIEGFLAEGFVAHRPNTPGQEVLLSLRRDQAFGPVVIVGVGGTLTEWYGKGCAGNSTLIMPAHGFDAAEAAAALAAHPLLSLLCRPSRLYRTPPVDAEALAGTMAALADLGRGLEEDRNLPWELAEIEVNPAVISEGMLVALDGVGALRKRNAGAAVRPVGKIRNLLQPASAVVMGVSAKGANPGRIILDNLLRSPGLEQGRLAVVHAREKEISGVPCYPDVAALPRKYDLAVVAIPAEGALEAIADIVACDKAEAVILIPGGFAEAGRKDLARDIEKVLDDAHGRPGGGPVMVGGNCLGIVSRDNYNTFFLPTYKLPFNPGRGKNLAMISQSGAYLVTFASNYDGLISPRASISFGNQMDLTVADFLEYFLTEPAVNVMACYVEGFRDGDGQRFLDFARRARTAGKRVIVFKAGKTPLGARAAASHTASLAGDYAVASSCLAGAGVTVAESLNHFEDLIMAFTLLADRPAAGLRTGIISNAGFECSTVMDQMAGLELAVFDAGTQAVLDEELPLFAHRTNPIDCTPMTGTDAFAAACRAILDSPAVDAAILSSVPVTPALNNLPPAGDGRHAEDLDDPRSQPRQMLEIIGSSSKPVVVVVDSGSIYDPMCRMLLGAGIPVFRKIDRAARALAAFCAETKRSS